MREVDPKNLSLGVLTGSWGDIADINQVHEGTNLVPSRVSVFVVRRSWGVVIHIDSDDRWAARYWFFVAAGG
jgi:hypothetical protein